jgi:N-acetyl-1-D-myo-inositol-2-amino-2-deoxy-alpha-D-glucopyranoside deacetylase
VSTGSGDPSGHPSRRWQDVPVRLPPARDLLLGLPVALLAGVAIGVLGSFKHQVGISAATGAGFPIGLVLALTMVAVVLAALRVAFETRVWSIAAAAGIVLAVTVLSNRGPGGSAVVLANYAGVVWTVAPAILAAVVLGMPRLGRRRGSRAPDGILDTPPEGDAT